MIRPVNIKDAAAICGIYNHYIKNTVITFEGIPVSCKEMEGRIQTIGAHYPWFVLEEGGDLAGYTYVNTWKDRPAYSFAAEVSIYLKTGREGQGLGTELFTRLFEAVEKTPIHAMVAGITLPNERSVALHERFGFKKIAQFNEIGFKMDTWLDVGYWERLLPKA
jgi:phosphinothricin acetyltransferase